MIITAKNYPHAKEYVNTWRKVIELAKNSPNLLIKIDWNMEKTCKDTRKWYINALHNRINFRGQDFSRGKKDNNDYFYQMLRDKHRLEDIIKNRVRVYQFETKEVNNRFSHLLSDYKDF